MIAQSNEIVNENLQDFQNHKKFAEKIQQNLAKTYTKLNILKKNDEISQRGLEILNCGSRLAFQRFFDPNHTTTLNGANFCKHKLCPFCAWRWHLKESKIIQKTFDLLGPQNYFHLVLTIPNIPYLNREFLLELRKKVAIFMKKVAQSKDYFIGFEITIDQNKHFHPHFHIVYIDHHETPITRKKIQTEWAKIANTGTNYAIAKQTKCTGQRISLELTKYILKFDQIEPSVQILRTISIATKGLHKFDTSGVIKEAEIEAKKIIDKEKFDKMLTLADYESEINIFEWFNGMYSLVETQLHKAKNDRPTTE